MEKKSEETKDVGFNKRKQPEGSDYTDEDKQPCQKFNSGVTEKTSFPAKEDPSVQSRSRRNPLAVFEYTDEDEREDKRVEEVSKELLRRVPSKELLRRVEAGITSKRDTQRKSVPAKKEPLVNAFPAKEEPSVYAVPAKEEPSVYAVPAKEVKKEQEDLIDSDVKKEVQGDLIVSGKVSHNEVKKE